ncbi:aminoglycoside phosphotransferase family protein [Streptomyces sp. NPDC004539]|uniref:phosphotransferase enzyme family protein n=1 Tax=Streptomyces sp. NPDC004539 TaxID=3154280 RepID=UPI0033B25613
MTGTTPTAALAWAAAALGARPAAEDVSHPRETSRVWSLTLPTGTRFYLKISARPVAYERETLALRHAAPALGTGRAPRLRASNAQHLALLLTAVPGHPVKRQTLTPAEEARAHRQAGTLLSRFHHAGDLSAARRKEAAQALRSTADGAGNHLHDACLTVPERRLVRGLTARLRALPPLPLAFVHGDAGDRNLLWSPAHRRAGWIDFARSRFATAVQDFVLLACTTWTDRPDLRAAFLEGYGRDLTPEEKQALACLAALDAVNCLARGPALGDAAVTARGRRTLDRLMAGVFA